jgi:non-homologous end joining protein Ku
MSTLRSADEVRPAEFGAEAKGEADPEMVAIAETRLLNADCALSSRRAIRDRYQDALRELVEAKTKGLATTPRAIAEPPKIIHLMEALKRIKATGSPAATLVGADRAQTSHAWVCSRPLVRLRLCVLRDATASKRRKKAGWQ